jgi:hypothetical protein
MLEAIPVLTRRAFLSAPLIVGFCGWDGAVAQDGRRYEEGLEDGLSFISINVGIA